jgi:hypothetical protein
MIESAVLLKADDTTFQQKKQSGRNLQSNLALHMTNAKLTDHSNEPLPVFKATNPSFPSFCAYCNVRTICVIPLHAHYALGSILQRIPSTQLLGAAAVKSYFWVLETRMVCRWKQSTCQFVQQAESDH